MTLTERPHKINFSKNEIRYVFELADLDRAGLFLQVKLLYKALSATTFDEVYTWDLKPASDGTIYLYIQTYLDSLLKYVLPDLTRTVTNADDQCRNFYIEYREVTDDEPDGDWTTDESDFVRLVLKGGIEKHKASRNNIFVNYIDPQKPFLTWQPASRFVFPTEPVFLTFLNRLNGLLQTGTKIKFTATRSDGTTYSTTLAATITGTLLHIKVNPQTLSLDTTSSNKVVYYDVMIVSASSTTNIINAYRFYIEYRPVYEYYDLVYHNSISGVDSVRICGEISHGFERDVVESEGGLKLDDWTSDTKPYEKFYSGILMRRAYKANAGILRARTKEQQEALMELFVSKSIYALIDGRWVPVLNVKESQDLGSRKNNTDGFPIEWSLSEANEVYTPKLKAFGQGTIIYEAPPPDECTPVDIADSTLPDARVGEAYHVTQALTGTLPYTLTILDKPDWMTIDIIGSNIDYSGTPDTGDEADDVTMSLTVSNCAPAVPFIQTINIVPAPAVTYGCGSVIHEPAWTSNTYHNYGYYYLDTAGHGTMYINWGSYDRPNRFTLINETDGVTVATTGWVGYAPYAGPWGSSLGTAETGTITFHPVAGKIYKLNIEAGNGIGSDSFSVTITCSG